jgi:hypothetical protein
VQITRSGASTADDSRVAVSLRIVTIAHASLFKGACAPDCFQAMNSRIRILLFVGAAGLAGFWLSRPRTPAPSFPAPVASLAPAAAKVQPVAGETSQPATEPESELFQVTLGGRRFSDPLEAVHFVDTGPAELRLAGYLRIAEAWGPIDLVAAARWAASIGDASMRSDLFSRLGEIVLPVSPDDAFSLAEHLPAGPSQNAIFRSLVHCWAEADPAAAADGLSRFADPALRAELQSAVAIEWAQNDPEGAATYVATQMGPGEARLSAARTVAMRWAHLDLAAARRWIASFPDAKTRDELLAHATLRAAATGAP